MINKNKVLRLILTSMVLLMAWGCAQKKELKPRIPEVALPPETVPEVPEENLVQVLVREAEQFVQDSNFQDIISRLFENIIYSHVP